MKKTTYPTIETHLNPISAEWDVTLVQGEGASAALYFLQKMHVHLQSFS